MSLPLALIAAGWLAGCDPSTGGKPGGDDSGVGDGGGSDGGVTDGGGTDGGVTDGGGTDLAPTVRWTAPADGSVLPEGEDLTLSVEVMDDGPEPLVVTFSSSLDGVLGEVEGTTSAALSWPGGSAGLHLLTATARDAGGQEASAELELRLDGRPSAPTVQVEPAAPLTGDDLRCAVVADGLDPEGGAVETALSWLVDGVDAGVAGDTVSAADTDRGEVWTCVGQTGDGVGWSEPGQAAVTVGNSPPGAPEVGLTPRVPFAGVDALWCERLADAEDADGDAVTYEVQWTRDGEAWTGGTATTALPGDTVEATDLQAGEHWSCTLWPADDLLVGEGASARATVAADPGLAPTGELSASSADATISGVASGDYVGIAVAFVGDLDGDGVQDLAVGAQGYDLGDRGACGAAQVYPGPLGGALDAADAYVLAGSEPSQAVGQALAGPGDLDGDGQDDLLVGGPDAASGGSDGVVHLVSGPLTGYLDLADATATLRRDRSGARLGRALAGVGDQTGDGLPDALVAGDEAAGGVAWLLSGALDGALDVEDAASAAITASAASDDLGACLAGPGDVDGDGVDDLLLGAPGHEGRGAAALFLGPLSLAGDEVGLLDADLLLLGSDAHSQEAGCGLGRVGDLDGDGRPDLVIGAADDLDAAATEGVAYLLTAPEAGVADLAEQADATLVGAADGDRLGSALSGGDLDGDDTDDLVLGGYRADLPDGSMGAAWIFYGPLASGTTLADADARIAGPAAGDQLAYALDVGGDPNDDGFADLVLGGYGADPVGSYSGAAWLFYGGP